MDDRPTLGSLFAGIGGIDLGFERAGFRTAWQVEIDPYCRKVLARHFPDAERYEDVRGVGSSNLRRVDVIAGGFPCQDISLAGLGAGIDGERSGLWREFARLIDEIRPRFVLVENVAALLGRGMGRVLGDLAALGYDAEWDDISAADLGAWHLRNRIWIVAYPKRLGCGGSPTIFDSRFYEERDREACEQRGWAEFGKIVASSEEMAYTKGERCGETRNDSQRSPQWPTGRGDALADTPSEREIAEEQRGRGYELEREGEDVSDAAGVGYQRISNWRSVGKAQEYVSRSTPSRSGNAEIPNAPSQRRGQMVESVKGRTHRERTDGAPEYGSIAGGWGWWATEPTVGRVAHGVPNRVDKLRGLGNSVVPIIPELIARRIHELLRVTEPSRAGRKES